jgi:hypothetical protein
MPLWSQEFCKNKSSLFSCKAQWFLSYSKSTEIYSRNIPLQGMSGKLIRCGGAPCVQCTPHRNPIFLSDNEIALSMLQWFWLLNHAAHFANWYCFGFQLSLFWKQFYCLPNRFTLFQYHICLVNWLLLLYWLFYFILLFLGFDSFFLIHTYIHTTHALSPRG